MTSCELFDTAEAVAYAVLQAAAAQGAISKGQAQDFALIAQLVPVIEELLRERIGSVGDLRGEAVD